MLLFSPIDFLSLPFDLCILFAALALVLLSWICIFIKAFHSHVSTPVIRNKSKTIYETAQFNEPFVSVIIPARNEEENIEKCLLSILKQSYSNLEVVAVDDNSDDRTLEIMRGFKSRQEFGKKLRII